MRASALALLGAALFAAGCASIDWDAPKTHTTVLARAPSPHLASALDAHPEESGFLLLIDGIEAFGARLLMAERAQASIDAQYYFILDDVTGHVFFRDLLRAADRGVRVRLLLDDIATQGYDPGLAALDSHPHFEVRIFNPFTRSKGRLFSGVSEFRRVNRRMHNKSFTVDGTATVIGGRNIGAEYFAARDDMNFGDLNVLGFGPVARDAGLAFDDYWNSEAAVPISVLVAPPDHAEGALAKLRKALEKSFATLDGTQYRAAVESTILKQVELEPDMLQWAPARVVYDAPEKSRTDSEADAAVADQLRAPLRKAIDEANEELLVISPYFVPLESGVAGLCALPERGVRTAVVTNSLASTDVSAVHAGYAPYRKDLLECGVELYEMRPDRRVSGAQRGGVGMSRSSLHAKSFVIDRRRLFVGSFNWDPRSVGINTEMGVLLDSVSLAKSVAETLESKIPHDAYEVVMENGEIRWVTHDDGQKVVLNKEPDTTFWQRFTAGFLGLLPIRGQL
jgi:putative cardiolipin synthase